MKKRILGLLAMVLCLMITCMPAMADIFVPHANGTSTHVYQGCLIEGGVVLTSDTSGGTGYVLYGTPSTSSPKVVELTYDEETTVDPGMWHVWNSDYYVLDLEPVGKLILSYPLEDYDGAQVFVFDKPFTQLGYEYDDNYNLIMFEADATGELQDWVDENCPGAAMRVFDADIFHEVTDGVWRSWDLIQQSNFYLPNVNGEVLAVLHWNHWGLDVLDFTVAENGLLKVEGLEACSPFAVVYKPAPEPTPAPVPAVPHTGDSTPLALLGVLACVSFAGIVLLVIRRRKAA